MKIDNEKIDKIIKVFVILWGLFVIYQIIRKLLGGSWEGQELMISIVSFNITAIVGFAAYLGMIRPDIKYMKRDISNIRADINNMRSDINDTNKRLDAMSADIQKLSADFRMHLVANHNRYT